MNEPKDTTHTLNHLLRDELAATQSYQQAFEALADAPGSTDLRRIRDDHREAANTLRLQIHEIGGDPVHSSGAWGTWAGMVASAAGRLGPRVMAETLKQGEEVGLRDYEKALQHDHLPTECKMLIHDRLLPHTREHIATLDRILECLKQG
jgi:bacterioferritin (cytochrome b1)